MAVGSAQEAINELASQQAQVAQQQQAIAAQREALQSAQSQVAQMNPSYTLTQQQLRQQSATTAAMLKQAEATNVAAKAEQVAAVQAAQSQFESQVANVEPQLKKASSNISNTISSIRSELKYQESPEGRAEARANEEAYAKSQATLKELSLTPQYDKLGKLQGFYDQKLGFSYSPDLLAQMVSKNRPQDIQKFVDAGFLQQTSTPSTAPPPLDYTFGAVNYMPIPSPAGTTAYSVIGTPTPVPVINYALGGTSYIPVPSPSGTQVYRTFSIAPTPRPLPTLSESLNIDTKNIPKAIFELSTFSERSPVYAAIRSVQQAVSNPVFMNALNEPLVTKMPVIGNILGLYSPEQRQIAAAVVGSPAFLFPTTPTEAFMTAGLIGSEAIFPIATAAALVPITGIGAYKTIGNSEVSLPEKIASGTAFGLSLLGAYSASDFKAQDIFGGKIKAIEETRPEFGRGQIQVSKATEVLSGVPELILKDIPSQKTNKVNILTIEDTTTTATHVTPARQSDVFGIKGEMTVALREGAGLVRSFGQDVGLFLAPAERGREVPFNVAAIREAKKTGVLVSESPKVPENLLAGELLKSQGEKDVLGSSIVSQAKAQNAILGGSLAQKIQAPSARPFGDFDVIAANPKAFAESTIKGMKEYRVEMDTNPLYGKFGKAMILDTVGTKVAEVERTVNGVDLFKTSKTVTVDGVKVIALDQLFKDKLSMVSVEPVKVKAAKKAAGDVEFLTKGKVTSEKLLTPSFKEGSTQAYTFYAKQAAEPTLFDVYKGKAKIALNDRASILVFKDLKIESFPKELHNLELTPLKPSEIAQVKRNIELVRAGQFKGLNVDLQGNPLPQKTLNRLAEKLSTEQSIEQWAIGYRLAKYSEENPATYVGKGAITGIKPEYELSQSLGVRNVIEPTTFRGKVGKIFGFGDVAVVTEVAGKKQIFEVVSIKSINPPKPISLSSKSLFEKFVESVKFEEGLKTSPRKLITIEQTRLADIKDIKMAVGEPIFASKIIQAVNRESNAIPFTELSKDTVSRYIEFKKAVGDSKVTFDNFKSIYDKVQQERVLERSQLGLQNVKVFSEFIKKYEEPPIPVYKFSKLSSKGLSTSSRFLGSASGNKVSSPVQESIKTSFAGSVAGSSLKDTLTSSPPNLSSGGSSISITSQTSSPPISFSRTSTPSLSYPRGSSGGSSSSSLITYAQETPPVFSAERPKKKNLLKKLQPAFQAQIRRRKQFINVGQPTTESKALKTGERTVLSTLAATFRVVPTKTLVEFEDTSYQPSARVFRPSKYPQPFKTYIQRKGGSEGGFGRLASQGERAEIKSYATIKKRAFGGFF